MVTLTVDNVPNEKINESYHEASVFIMTLK